MPSVLLQKVLNPLHITHDKIRLLIFSFEPRNIT